MPDDKHPSHIPRQSITKCSWSGHEASQSYSQTIHHQVLLVRTWSIPDFQSYSQTQANPSPSAPGHQNMMHSSHIPRHRPTHHQVLLVIRTWCIPVIFPDTGQPITKCSWSSGHDAFQSYSQTQANPSPSAPGQLPYPYRTLRSVI